MGWGTLLSQIRTAFTGDSDLSGALNALDFEEVVNTPAFPYGTYKYIAGSGQTSNGNVRLDSKLIQFSLFDKGSDAATLAAAYDKLIALYDNLNVASGGRTYQFDWEFDESYKVEGVWHIICQYRVTDHPT